MVQSVRPKAEQETEPGRGDGPAGGMLAYAAQVLAGSRGQALTNWIGRLEQEAAACGWPSPRLNDVLGDAPCLLDAVLAALHPDAVSQSEGVVPDLAGRIRRQTACRLVQGAPLAAILTEQALLRDEMWALFNQRLLAECRPADLLALARALDGALQQVLEVCILTACEGPAAELAA